MPTCTASTSSCPTSPTCATTPTASRRCVATHGHEDHVGAPLLPAPRPVSFPIYGSPLTLGLARNRIEEAGLLGRTELIPVADGERRQIGPFDVEFIPVTHSVPHAFAIALHTPAGRDPALGRLQARPHARSTAAVTDLARIGALAAVEGIRLLLCRLDQRRGARVRTERDRASARCCRRLFAAARRPAHHHRQLRQPHPPHPADRRRRHRPRPQGGHARAVDAQERAAGPRPRASCSIPDASLVDIEDVVDLPPGEVCIISTGSQGEPMSALSLLAQGENRWLKVDDRRHGGALEPRHPGQRVQRQPGDRRAAAARRRGRALAASPTCTPPATPRPTS